MNYGDGGVLCTHEHGEATARGERGRASEARNSPRARWGCRGGRREVAGGVIAHGGARSAAGKKVAIHPSRCAPASVLRGRGRGWHGRARGGLGLPRGGLQRWRCVGDGHGGSAVVGEKESERAEEQIG